MALRFHSKSYDTTSGVTYSVQLYDTEFVGTSLEFECGPDIFTLDWAGEMRSGPVWVQPSECRFSMYIDTVSKRNFVGDLTDAQEGRFQIKIYKDGAFWWCGNMLVDDTSHPDLEDYFFQLTASDMLGSLRDIDFAEGTDPYANTDTFIQIIQKCLEKTGLLSFGWGAGDVCIRTADNWYEDDMPTGTANDPLALSRTRHRALYDVDDRGRVEFNDTLTALEQVLRAKNLLLRQSEGSWRIYQYGEYVPATLAAERRYDRDGALLSSAAGVDITRPLDQDAITALKENIVNLGWYRSLRRVQVTYRAKNTINYLAGQTWTASDEREFEEIRHNDGAANLFFRFTLKIDYSYVGGGVTPVPIFALWRLRLKVGDRYLKRTLLGVGNYTFSYSDVSWTTAPSYFEVCYEAQSPQGAFSMGDTAQLEYLTPNLLESGTLAADLFFVGLRKRSDGSPVSFASSHTVTFKANNSTLYAYSNGLPLTDTSDELHEATNDLATNGLDYETAVLLGDGTTPNTQGRIEVYNGSDWEDSAAWSVGGAGGTLPLLSLLAKQIVAGRKTPPRRLTGDIWDKVGNMAAHSRIDDSSTGAVWLMVRASYNARMERWSGEWYYVADSSTDITVPAPVATAPLTPKVGPVTGGTGGSGGVVVPTSTGTVPGTVVIGGPATGAGGTNPLLTSGSTSSSLPTGSITSIPVTGTLTGGAFTQGQVISVINPVTGYTQNFTVTADVEAGDTSINVSGYVADDFPTGSYIVVSPQNATVQGFGSGSSSTSTNAGQTSNWWEIFQQWWEVDNTNDIDWPIEAPNVVFETDENAGNGSTAGVRFDGDGLQSFDSSNTTPGVKIGLAGKLELNNLDTGTGTDGLIVEGGVVKKKTLGTIITDHGGLTGLGDDDHVQYIAKDGRSGGQTLKGGTASGDDLTLESTANATKGDIIVKDPFVLTAQGSHPTPAAGHFYLYNDFPYVKQFGVAKVWPVMFPSVEFTVIGYGTNWATGVKDAFWRITSQHANMDIFRIGYGTGASLGSGTGNNSVAVKHFDGTTTTTVATLTLNTFTNNLAAVSQALAQGDVVYFDCTSVRATTPAQGLWVAFYLRKT